MEMQKNSSEAGMQSTVGTLESFMYFPAPLALLDSEGRLELANTRFAQCIGRGEIDPKGLAAVAMATDSDWHRIAGTAAPCARAIKTPHRILLVVEDPGEARPPQALEALLARVKELEQLVATDHLTGAWNRSHLDRVIRTEITRSLSYRQPLSLTLIDVDHFKKINDTYGHPAGDAVLCALVGLVKSRVRASDLLFRWGGEEFVILSSATGHRHAETMAESVRLAVSKHRFPATGALTVSLGVAEHDANEDADTWFGRLDAALYAAKDRGRNRVVADRAGNSDQWAAERGTSALRLEWMEGYECGNTTIDEEHREIFRLANALIDASLLDPFDPVAFATALGALIDHAELHFADEETILQDYCYAQLDEHRRSHAGLLARAQRFRKMVASEKFDMGRIVEFLAQDLVARHLRIVDRGFFPLFSPPSSA